MSEPIRFGELVGLMVHGTGSPDSIRGVVRAIDDRRTDTFRVWRRGDLTREEDLDGAVRDIRGPTAYWYREPGSGEVSMRPHEGDVHVHIGSPIGGLDVGGSRPSWQRWEGADFTRPAGPIEATEFLGRAAYSFELAPPSHKPYPMQLIVDADTGLLLRTGNVAFGTSREWVELEVDVDLPDDVFQWTGRAQTVATFAEQIAATEQEEARRREWLTARGVALTLPVDTELLTHEDDDASGAFIASFHSVVHGVLHRRPHGTSPSPTVDKMHYSHAYRWSDERWDWILASEQQLDDAQLAAIREQLATTT